MLNSKDIIFYYPMEGNINDASGNGNDGFLINNPTISDGVSGSCYLFNGTSQTIRTLQNIGDLSSGFTISCWIYYTNTTDTYSEIYRKEDGNNRLLFSFQTGNVLSFGINVGSYNELDISINRNDYINKWVNVAVTYDNATKTRTVYKDGAVIGTDTRSGTFSYGGTAYGYIGSSGATAEWFKGKIDNFIFFRKPLSQSDIRRIMLNIHPICI